MRTPRPAQPSVKFGSLVGISGTVMSDPNPDRFKLLRIYCEASSIAAVVLGCLVLCGWAFHIEILKTVLPGLVTMKANTALGIAFSGASLWLLLPADSGTKRKN